VTELAILDVGHGNSAVLRDKKGTVVIDTGPGSTLLEFLEHAEIRSIDLVLLSHADEDHIGGLVQLLASQRVKVRKVVLNTDSLKGSAIWDDLVYELAESDKKGDLQFITSLVADSTGEFDQGDVRIEIVAPGKYLAVKGAGSTDRKGRKLSSNSLSAVVRLVHAGSPAVIFMGDIDLVGLENLEDAGGDATAEIMVFPHHGGKAGSASIEQYVRKLLEMVSPKVALFSVGRGRSHHPRRDVMEVARQLSPALRIACTQLSTHCAKSLPLERPPHLTNAYAKGWENNSCCGGTFIVHFGQNEGLQPDANAHASFIKVHASTALCVTSRQVQK
jgi:beta-lactamase superfamily II metal-dependent hydrolase